MKRYCYQCRNTFSSYSDYCPHDGTKLETFKAKKSFSESKVSSNNKLNSFLKKFNLKPVSKKFSKDDLGVPLPKDLQELGWCYTGPVASCSYVDTWPVECNLNQKSSIFGLFRRFRSGSLSNYNIYQKVQKINKKLQLSQVSAYGTTDFGGARTDYELVVLPKDGINLAQWFLGSNPSEERALFILPKLVQLLINLSKNSLIPIYLEPNWLHFIKDNNEIILLTAATLTEFSKTEIYRSEFSRNSLISILYSAPEITQQNIQTDNSVIFSVGQLLAIALWGQELSIDEINQGRVPFNKINDGKLAKIMMGCLWPKYHERWNIYDLSNAIDCSNIENLAHTPNWITLNPSAASKEFILSGKSYWRLEDLINAARKSENWDESCIRIKDILNWAKDTPWHGKALLLQNELKNGSTPDWILLKLQSYVLSNMPLTWRSFDFSDNEVQNSLIGIAQQSLTGNTNCKKTLKQLFHANLCDKYFESNDSQNTNII